MKNTEGYVYLICDPLSNRFKVGVTKGSIEKRILKLQTGNSTELHITNWYKTKYPFRMEKMLHTKFIEYRTHGEWFELPDNIIFSFTSICEKVEKSIEILKENPFFVKGLRE